MCKNQKVIKKNYGPWEGIYPPYPPRENAHAENSNNILLILYLHIFIFQSITYTSVS